MQKIYDINFKLKTSMLTTIQATSKKQAKEFFMEYLMRMPQNELVDLFINAVNFDPQFTITSVDYVDDYAE